MRKHMSTIVLAGIFLIGLSLLLYPTVSDYWNSFHQSQAITGYAETVAGLDDVDYEQIMEDARNYNQELAGKAMNLKLSEAEEQKYESVLDVTGNGMMGYIEIPSIKCSLPIYHGTDDNILQTAIGHIPGTSLPVGGASTHCVLSGHRGLPSARLFTDLDKLTEGDVFMIRVLDETLTYEVDQILIVDPDEIDSLQIEEGKDYCTLVTCTPYGVNTHRLLVRGHRIANLEDSLDIRVTSDAIQIDSIIVAAVVAVPILLILLIVLLISTRKRR